MTERSRRLRTSPRRVLALFTDLYGSDGGIAAFNRQLVESLHKVASVRLTAVSLFSDDLPIEVPPGTRWVSAPRHNRTRYVQFALFQAAVIRPELVICGHINLSPLAVGIGRLFRAPVWTTTHGLDIFEPPKSFMRRVAFEKSHLVTTVSDFSCAKLLSWSRLEPDRVMVLPNTADPTKILLDPMEGTRDRSLHNRDIPTLITVARLVPHKRHDIVLDAILELKRRGIRTRYVIVGQGPGEPTLRQRAIELGISDDVHFTGFVSRHDIASWMSLADISVLMSEGDGFGIVILEAALVGLRTLVAAGTAPAEVANMLGLDVVPESSPNTLADSLEVALSQTIDRSELRNKAIQCFGPQAFNGRVRNALEKLCGKARLG